MPVVKGKRDTSPTEYVYQARELRKYTIQKCVGFPKRYTFYVSQPIADLSNEVYNHAIKANSIFPKKAHEARLRGEHLLEARASALAMVAEIEVAAELFDIEDKKKDFWMGLLNNELKLLKGVLESDADRFKDLPE